MLVDTDVLIWHLRGLPRAAQRLDRLPKLIISAVTWMELLQGMRDRAELEAVRKSLVMRNTEQLQITPAITRRAIALMENFSLSHGLGMGDALIGATALEHGVPLLTGNVKHFSPIVGLVIERFDRTQDTPL
ncbi:MAG: type II toxin-antitoxin system VapC family toxin [Burkholderiales bacterium]